MALSKHEATDKMKRETLGCITRHWCGLTEELKSTLQRLEHSPTAMDTSQATKLFEALSTLKVALSCLMCMLDTLRLAAWRPLLSEVRLELTGALCRILCLRRWRRQ